MKLPYKTISDSLNRSRFSIILANPQNQENIGLVARAMKNTGFSELRLVGLQEFEQEAYRPAVHARDILKKAIFCQSLPEAVADLNLVLASTARQRKAFQVITIDQAVEKIRLFPSHIKVGLVFGNERTGLSDIELRQANFVYFIPQSSRQPSYNLAAAVLITLYTLFRQSAPELVAELPPPLPHKEQAGCLQIISAKLEKNGFIHDTNRQHVTNLLYDLFGRLTLSERDQRFLAAIFNKGLNSK